MPFVKAHASATKNGKLAEMHLHLELVAELRTLKTDGVTEDDFIFGRMPRIEGFRRDLKPAGIPLHDARGREWFSIPCVTCPGQISRVVVSAVAWR